MDPGAGRVRRHGLACRSSCGSCSRDVRAISAWSDSSPALACLSGLHRVLRMQKKSRRKPRSREELRDKTVSFRDPRHLIRTSCILEHSPARWDRRSCDSSSSSARYLRALQFTGTAAEIGSSSTRATMGSKPPSREREIEMALSKDSPSAHPCSALGRSNASALMPAANLISRHLIDREAVAHCPIGHVSGTRPFAASVWSERRPVVLSTKTKAS